MWSWRRLGGFPGGSVIKNLSANAEDARDVGLISGLETASGTGNGHPLQYSCVEKSNGERSLTESSP